MSAFADTLEWLTDGANWKGSDGILHRLVEHIGLSAATVGIACAIALPVALYLGHIGRGGVLAVNVSNIGRAVPTFAALVLLAFVPSLGLGTKSTILALVLFAIPPLLTNAYVGMREVDRDVVESARGMGMTGLQLLRKVEVPLATPLIMTGVRLCAVQVVATATIAALVAGPGLGRIITAGYGRQDQAQVVGGAVLVTALALLVEAVFALLQRRVDPVRRVRARAAARTPGNDRVPTPVET